MHSRLRQAVVMGIHQASWWTGLSAHLAARRRGARILLLHQVGVGGYTSDDFRRHLTHLVEHYRIVPLAQALEAASEGRRDADRMVALTFDDGFRNSMTALPLLQEFRAPATFFVCPALIDRGEWLWTTDCRERLRSLSVSERSACLQEDMGPAASPDVIVEWMKGLPEERRIECHRAIRGRTPSFTPTAEQRRALDLLTWEELRSLPEDLVAIGSHGMEHRVLTRVDDATLTSEIEESRDWLVRELRRPVMSFSYPNGRFDDRVASRAGSCYKAAFTAEPGLLESGTDRFRIPRVNVPRGQASLAWRLHCPGWAGGRE